MNVQILKMSSSYINEIDEIKVLCFKEDILMQMNQANKIGCAA